MSAYLVAMRLADMTVVHPRQDESRVCSKCGERVGIYPSGQKALEAEPKIVIVCVACGLADPEMFGPDVEHRAAGTIAEIRQEVKESERKLLSGYQHQPEARACAAAEQNRAPPPLTAFEIAELERAEARRDPRQQKLELSKVSPKLTGRA